MAQNGNTFWQRAIIYNKHTFWMRQSLLQSAFLNQPTEADKTFERVLAQCSQKQIPERWQLVIRNYRGLAMILSGQQEKYVACLEDGISGALALGSKKRFDEALDIFQYHMPQAWHSEPRIKQVAERFQLERESKRDEELEI